MGHGKPWKVILVFIIHYTLYVHYTLYIICTLYIIHYTYIIHHILYIIRLLFYCISMLGSLNYGEGPEISKAQKNV